MVNVVYHSDCGSLPTLAHGQITLDETDMSTFNSSATQVCDTGYAASSQDSKIHCLETGQWPDPTVNCTRVGESKDSFCVFRLN